MLMQGDSDLNSVHVYIDSLKEAFKHTMLNQEVIFRKQVQELHRLYMVQITLMKNLGCKEFDDYISWKDNTQSSLINLTDPVRHGPLLKETRVSSFPMVGSMQSFSQESLGQRVLNCKLQHMPFGLQPPANMYIRYVDKDFPNQGNVVDRLQDALESHAGNISDAMDLTLSLSLGEESRRRESKKRTWFAEKNLSWPQAVMNFGEVEHSSSLGCIASIACSGEKHGSHVTVLSAPTIPGSLNEDISHEIVQGRSIVVDHQNCQERCSFSQGNSQEFKGPQNDAKCSSMSFKKQEKLASYETRPMDLNKFDLNDCSCYSNDPMMTYPSSASSSGGFSEIVGKDKEDFCPTKIWRKEVNDCSNETSDLLQRNDTVNVALINLNSKNKRTEIWPSNSKVSEAGEIEVSPTGLKSVSRLPMDVCEDHGSCGSDAKSEKAKAVSEIQGVLLNDLNNPCLVTGPVSCETSEVEDTLHLICSGNQNSDQDKHENKSVASCMSSCIVDNVSKTTQSGIESGNSSICAFDQFSEINLQTQAAKNLSGGQDQRSSDSNEITEECIHEKGESAELDIFVQRAAESLVNISMMNPACSQDCSTRSGSNEIEHEDSLQPQNSSDSFELNTLKLAESSLDEFSVSSMPLKVNEVDKKDFGVKLKRGRRMKDFQKDILPVLASLSRHEICEDINILEGVLRSKEYRKNRAMMADGERSLPSRSRRTRLNYVRRRNIS